MCIQLQRSFKHNKKTVGYLEVEVQIKLTIMIAIIVNELSSLPSLVIPVIVHISDSSVISFLFILTLY